MTCRASDAGHRRPRRADGRVQQARADDAATVPAGLRRRHVEHGDRRGAPRRARGYVTRVGDDAFGRMLLELWADEGVDTRGVAIDADAPTGIYFVTHGPQRPRVQLPARGIGGVADGAGDAAARRDPRRAACCTCRASARRSARAPATRCSPRSTRRAAAGVRVSYDPNLRLKLWPLPRARAVITATVARCDWFLPSLDDARIAVRRRAEPQAIIDWCHAPARRSSC